MEAQFATILVEEPTHASMVDTNRIRSLHLTSMPTWLQPTATQRGAVLLAVQNRLLSEDNLVGITLCKHGVAACMQLLNRKPARSVSFQAVYV